MVIALSVIFALPAFAALFVTLVFSAEIIVACTRMRPEIGRPRSSFSGKIAVLVPAHNEESGIAETLSNIKSHLRPGDRLLVVADNCTDNTAGVARALGAEVTARFDPSRRGKGYALDWGLTFLAPDPPDIVVVIDADCHIVEGTLASLASESALLNRPVQALYVMTASARSSVGQHVAEFAWRVRNQVRPLGLKRVKLPCQLMGTGMAFPWKLIRSANLANGHIVEDLKLGLDLAKLGSAPLFYPETMVASTFPSSGEGIRAQRQRWEHGHIGLIRRVAIPLLRHGMTQRDIRLTALSLDLLVPPVSLLGLIILALLVVTGLAAACGLTAHALILSASCLVLLATSTMLAWWKFGTDILPARSLLQIPVYLVEKLPVYAKLVRGRGVSYWVRSDRA